MKKILVLAAIFSALTLTLTGCTGGNSSNSDSSLSSDALTQEEHESDIAGAEDSTPSDVIAGDASDEGNATTSDEENSSNAESTELGEQTRAQVLGNAAYNAVEFPAMTDTQPADLDLEGIEVEESFYQTNLMSPHLYRVIVIKPAAGSEEKLAEVIDAYAAGIKDKTWNYEDQEISAAGTVSGVTSDGYYYVIVHADGATAEEALLAA